MSLKDDNERLRARVDALERQMESEVQRARVEGERRFWRAAYEELLDKMVAKLEPR